MTKLLHKAFEEASRLSDSEQDALARWLLDELDAERRWDDLLASSDDELTRMANEAIDEFRRGKTQPLDPEQL